MSSVEIGLVSFPILIGLIFLRMPIGLSMLLIGFVGAWIVTGTERPILAQLKSLPFDTFSSYSLSIVPLFLLMGQFATRGGLSRALFRASETWLGHRKGGVAMAAVGACGAFGAICGSSLVTASTMGQVALPELRRFGYSGALATGCVSAGGTLGILIPPSVVLVIYAILTEQNIAKLFVAAFVPGVLAAIGYILTISVYVRLFPEAAGLRAPSPFAERWRALLQVWPVLAIFVLVIGGIYLGWFTPTEAAAVGAAGTGLVAYANGGLTWSGLSEAMLETAVATGMIFFILLGAAVFNGFLAFSQLPQEAATAVAESGLSPWFVLCLMLACYLIFGCVMESLSMILLTVPIFFPIMLALDFGLSPEHTALWFGILVLIVVEVGLITPPVGMNLFIINSMSKDVPISATYRGALPFIICDFARVCLLILFPGITLWLVTIMF